MVDIPLKVETAVDKNSILALNRTSTGAKDKNSILELNKPINKPGIQTADSISANAIVGNGGSRGDINYSQNNADIKPVAVQRIVIPELKNTLTKGQKASLGTGNTKVIRVCVGWNVKNPECDVDGSVFLLSGKKVPGDGWFVFYAQPKSPDGSTVFSAGNDTDREIITIDFDKINKDVDRLVFVLTINDAIEKKLNFSMIQDAYIRIIDTESNEILTSFLINEYYDNVTSMMIGEVYSHNGIWKFNAVGNGVTRDLAGLCELYGVEID